MGVVDRFNAFLEVSEMYELGLNLYSEYGTKSFKRFDYFLALSPIGFLYFDINNAVFNITRNIESVKSNNLFDEDVLNSFCKKIIEKYELNKAFSYDSNMSAFEVIESIRNCLAHSNYSCYIGAPLTKDYIIKIKNYRIEGDIDLKTINKISEEFNNFSIGFSTDYLPYRNIKDICNLKNDSKKDYKLALESIKKASPLVFKQNLVITSAENIDKEEKNLIKSYIDYYGLDKWVKLSPERREHLFHDVIRVITNKSLNYDCHATFDEYLNYFVFSKIFQKSFINNKEVMFYSPIMYSNVLMEYSFYILNYLREASEKEGIKPLVYKNVYVDSFKFNNLSKDDYVKYVDNTEMEIQYYNCSQLFRRLRNSVSHGKFMIDYSIALKTKNFSNMIVRFIDNENSSENKFDVEIRAGDLLSIFKQLTNNMKDNANYFQKEKEIVCEVDDTISDDEWENYIKDKEVNSNIVYKRDDREDSNTSKKAI